MTHDILINIADLDALSNCEAGQHQAFPESTADINGDGGINSLDVATWLQENIYNIQK